MKTWLQKVFKDNSYGDSGKVSQAGRIARDLLGQLLGDFMVFPPEKFMQQPLLSSAVHKIKSIFMLYSKHNNKEYI